MIAFVREVTAQPVGVEVHRHGVDVDEHGTEARERDDVRGRGEGVGGNEDGVARREPERLDGEVERRRARGDREGVGRPAGAAELLLERRHLRALGEHAALEHAGHRGKLLGAGVGAGEPDSLYLSRYHAIVRSRPSSSSTRGSQPSSSRAFSTFGIRSSTST